MWRPLKESDLIATLSKKEVDAYRTSASADGGDPVADLLSRTAALVRGYVRAGGRATLSPVPGEIPEGLISPAADYAAYDVLKRMPVAIGEDRRRARDQAISLFDKVASGAVAPEDDGGGEGVAESAPRYRRRRMILD